MQIPIRSHSPQSKKQGHHRRLLHYENLKISIWYLIDYIFCTGGYAVLRRRCGKYMEDSGEVSGSAGILVAVLMLAGGIVSIATRASEKRGGNIALLVLFGLAALLGFSNYGSYSDLAIWSGWCLINAVLAVVALVLGSKQA